VLRNWHTAGMSQEAANAAQAAYWTEVRGAQWVRDQRIFDTMLAPFGNEALRILDAQLGEHVLDIGCGTGTTTVQIAQAVGPTGRVTGCDIASTMIDAARRSALALPQVSFEVLDVQTGRLGDALYDAAFSRFGVMFFDDPVAAFQNVANFVRSRGRLVFVCWQHEDDNDWISLPAAVMRQFTPEPVLPTADAPGPFAFRDPNRVRRILKDAGWIDIEVTPFAAPARLGAGLGLDEALTQTMGLHPAHVLRRQVDDETFTKATAAVRGLLAEHMANDEVVFRANAWIAQARNP